MNNKGFVMVDSLLSVIIVSVVALLSLLASKSLVNYKEGYINYKTRVNERYMEIYSGMKECEVCQIIQEDSSYLEQYSQY